MTLLKEGSKAPAFTVMNDAGKPVSLPDYKGRPVVLYFYPKDDTPGCTAEACDFRDNLPHFEGLNAAILGVSRDSVEKHGKFRKKFGLTFPLLADTDGAICNAYGTWIEKSMYGKKYMGIDRATFLIDGQGVIRAIWRKVKVKGHVEEVAKALESL